MRKNVTPSLIHAISENWENRRRAEETQELIEAIVAELKQDYREWQRNHRMTSEAQAHWEGLIADVQDQAFWDKLDHLLQFSFDY